MTLRKFLFVAATFVTFFTPSVGFSASDDAEHAPDLVTDRPDFTESSTAVPRGYLQFELGTSLSSTDSATVLSPGNTLLRYGILRNLELRLGASPLSVKFDRSGDSNALGLRDATLGVKYAGEVSEGLRLGVIPSATLSEAPRDPKFSSGAIGTLALSGEGDVSLAMNLGFGGVLAENESEKGLEASGSIAAGADLPADFGAFIEMYATAGPSQPLHYFADTGFTYLLTPRYQLDTFFAVGIPEFQTLSGGVGVSFIL